MCDDDDDAVELKRGGWCKAAEKTVSVGSAGEREWLNHCSLINIRPRTQNSLPSREQLNVFFVFVEKNL